MTSGRSFLTTDIVLDEEVSWTVWYITNLGQVHKAIYDYAHKALPAPTKNTWEGAVPSQINPGNQVLLKTWKEVPPKTNYYQNGKAPCEVILAILTAVRLQGKVGWVHLSRLKLLPPKTPRVTREEQSICEPVENLRCLLQA